VTKPAIGLFALNQHAGADALVRLVPLAEELGYESLWMGEHVVVPDPRRPPSPMEPDEPIHDPLVALAFAAALSKTIRLATGIVILPQRNPVVLAKQLASLDSVSGGRLICGLGVGYLEPELTAVGVPMPGRGRRADDYLAAMRALWEEERPSYEGEFVRFAGVNAHPRPVQRPLPVVIGGHTTAAHRRAARSGQGWYGFLLDLDQTAAQVAGLRRALSEAGRDPATLELTVSPSVRIDPDTAEAFGELGVHRLVLLPHFGADLETVERFVRRHAPRPTVDAS
jgi:probable F420-dependent oxidoreductase